MNEISNIIDQQEHEFAEVINIIQQHRSAASRLVNEELLLTAWHVGSYVSAKLKSEEWGSKVVSQLSEYIRLFLKIRIIMKQLKKTIIK